MIEHWEYWDSAHRVGVWGREATELAIRLSVSGVKTLKELDELARQLKDRK